MYQSNGEINVLIQCPIETILYRLYGLTTDWYLVQENWYFARNYCPGQQ